MLRSIQAECYKATHRIYFRVCMAVAALFSVGVVLCLYFIKTEASGVNPINMPFAVTALLFGMSAGLYLVILGVDIVFSEQYKYNTLKNEVSFGIGRLRIYISRWLVTLLVLGMLYLVLIGVYTLASLILLACPARRTPRPCTGWTWAGASSMPSGAGRLYFGRPSPLAGRDVPGAGLSVSDPQLHDGILHLPGHPASAARSPG